jgi:uncharacterized protein YbjT (DUF2867 family)
MSGPRFEPLRSLLLAGASGLVGRQVLAQALADPQVEAVHALLRRPLDLPADPRRQEHRVDFAAAAPLALPALAPRPDAALCALGTTIALAGSEAAFRAVDHDAVLAFARAARQAGIERLAVVSALGADARSPVFYNRVKGEAESALRGLGFRCLVLARPSLLLGDRQALGQPRRHGEGLAQAIGRPLAGLVPARWRPVEADVVARALLRRLALAAPGVQVVESAALQREGRR